MDVSASSAGWGPTSTVAMDVEMGSIPLDSQIRSSQWEASSQVHAPDSTPQCTSAATENDIEAAQGGQVAGELHWSFLPALPLPDLQRMRTEASVGCSTVLGIIMACVSITHLSVFKGSIDEPLQVLILSVIWTLVLIALLCLLGLVFGDPGVIARSEERCAPVPEGRIRELLASGTPLSSQPDVRNVEDATHGSYCVRCLVWRRHEEKAHHCSICQRCVRFHDHHCGVFGRCIAGQGFGGNMGYFKVIILTGTLGGVMTMTAAIVALYPMTKTEHAAIWVGIAIAIYCGISLLMGLGRMLCMSLRARTFLKVPSAA